ncbi:hypothetical protein KCP73_22325 [Salmonella enterica subsp. enterica]|nr:hypothetical protein KCP73_22325 [Salmonella enterica subsp. enterica]
MAQRQRRWRSGYYRTRRCKSLTTFVVDGANPRSIARACKLTSSRWMRVMTACSR